MSDETVEVDMELDVVGVINRPKDSVSGERMLRPMSEICPAMTDFSNYLNQSSDASDDDLDMAMVDTDGYLHVAEAPDVYGWNAEWDRFNMSKRGDSLVPRNRGGRKAAKVSLLQRVLSVGRATAVGRRAGFSG